MPLANGDELDATGVPPVQATLRPPHPSRRRSINPVIDSERSSCRRVGLLMPGVRGVFPCKIKLAKLARHREGKVVMKTVDVIDVQGGQVVKLPDEFRFRDPSVAIRKVGEAVILEPVKPATWPPGFFRRNQDR